MSKFIRKKHFCGVVAEAYESRSNILFVRFFATPSGMESDFSLLYTAFTKKRAIDGKNTTLACGPDEFDCDDDTCIDSSLYCDGQPNCKFKKDELNCIVCNELFWFVFDLPSHWDECVSVCMCSMCIPIQSVRDPDNPDQCLNDLIDVHFEHEKRSITQYHPNISGNTGVGRRC